MRIAPPKLAQCGSFFYNTNYSTGNRQEGNIRFNEALRRERDKPDISFLADEQYRYHILKIGIKLVGGICRNIRKND